MIKTDREKLKEICDKIGYKKGEIECWDCMRKKDMCFSGKWKGVNGKCSICGFEGKDMGLLQSNISSCCKGKYKTAGGFIWKFST